MIIPIDALDKETLRNIAESYVLREGTDYGEQEVSFEQKVEEVLVQLGSGEILLQYSEEHETIDIIPRSEAAGFRQNNH
jgi:uncharacterized protein YheU (UPF0270 family)